MSDGDRTAEPFGRSRCVELRSASRPSMEQVTAMSWAGDSRLVVVGREQGGVQQMRYVQVDGSVLEGPAPAALSPGEGDRRRRGRPGAAGRPTRRTGSSGCRPARSGRRWRRTGRRRFIRGEVGPCLPLGFGTASVAAASGRGETPAEGGRLFVRGLSVCRVGSRRVDGCDRVGSGVECRGRRGRPELSTGSYPQGWPVGAGVGTVVGMRGWWQDLTDLVLPAECGGCGTPRTVLCAECRPS